MKCRHCATPLNDQRDVFVDLGAAPPSNAFLKQADLLQAEAYFPLKVFTCPACHLVQVDEVQRHDALFSSDYVYFSSFSSSWLAHAQAYVAHAVQALSLNAQSLVMEVASNDGYLLQYVKAQGIPCVGIEPTESTAEAARAKGIDTLSEFFGQAMAHDFVRTRGQADLIVGNNVLAHVPDVNDFVAGLAVALAPQGCITVEFPHLLELVQQSQFDTIYHEHFSYLSLHTVKAILARCGLSVWHVEALPTHGGSLRVWAQHQAHDARRAPTQGVQAMLAKESAAGMLEPAFYRGLQARADQIKDDLLDFLIQAKKTGRKVMAYGAAAKGNTLLNYAGVRPDLLPAVVDASPHKQGRYLPGSRIPVLAPSAIDAQRPDLILILPWNLRDEITTQLAHARQWGARFVTAVPSLHID
jgi:SAM-dependent methyltransferase